MKLKLIFATFFGIIIIMMSYGSQEAGSFVRNSERFFSMAKKTFEYKQMFARDNNQSFLAAAIGALPMSSGLDEGVGSSEDKDALSVPVLVYHGITERSNGERLNSRI